MKLDIDFHGITLPIEIAQICSPVAAVVYAVLNDAAENGITHLSNNEIGKRAGMPGRSVPAIISKLEKLGIVERHYNPGYATSYYVKDILPAEQPEPEQGRVAAPAEVPAEPVELARQSEEQTLPKVPSSSKYKFPYYVMLSAINSPLADDLPLSEADVDAITDERETEECTIPSDWAFSDNQKMIEDALKYLSYFSHIKEGQLKEVKEDVIISLAEAICTGKKGTVHGADPYLIVNRINTIIHSTNINLSQWLDDFTRIFSKKYDSETKKIYNYHSYLKTAAINYLSEYKAQIYNGFYEDE